MLKKLTPLASLLAMLVSWLLFALVFLKDALGWITLPAALPEAGATMIEFIDALASIPWQLSGIVSVALIFLTHHLFKVANAREIIIRSEMEIVDLRAGAVVDLDLDRGRLFLLRPVCDTTIKTPVNEQEGMFRLFVLFGPTSYPLTFDSGFDFVSPDPGEPQHAPGMMAEYQIMGVKVDGRVRYFVNETMAYFAVMNIIRNEARDGISQAKSAAWFYGLT